MWWQTYLEGLQFHKKNTQKNTLPHKLTLLLYWANPYTAKLSATIVVSNPFYLAIKSQLLWIKLVFKHPDLQMFVIKLNKCK